MYWFLRRVWRQYFITKKKKKTISWNTWVGSWTGSLLASLSVNVPWSTELSYITAQLCGSVSNWACARLIKTVRTLWVCLSECCVMLEGQDGVRAHWGHVATRGTSWADDVLWRTDGFYLFFVVLCLFVKTFCELFFDKCFINVLSLL